jgi:outer membrane autotransporter protein
MKRETYYYHYYDQSGQYRYNGWTMRDKNKHHLSVLTLGAGYEYKISEKLAFSAEPYVKLPLAGVGFGKIKLNSGGILI